MFGGVQVLIGITFRCAVLCSLLSFCFISLPLFRTGLDLSLTPPYLDLSINFQKQGINIDVFISSLWFTHNPSSPNQRDMLSLNQGALSLISYLK